MSAIGLTTKQAELLRFIEAYTAANDGVSPTFEEMGDAIGQKSKSGVHRLLAGLEERCCIRRLTNRARAIEVLRSAAPVIAIEVVRGRPEVVLGPDVTAAWLRVHQPEIMLALAQRFAEVHYPKAAE